MEISKQQIARLVLGYLKKENCTTAFNEFLTSSLHLKQHAIFIKNGKYFATRVCGLTLEDIINEYAEISVIVQEKLEETNYYDEHRAMTLLNQLKYLLNHISTCSDPLLSDDLNTTPSESLPGNSSPRKTPDNSNRKLPNSFSDCSPIEHDSRENISQILSQTLLEKPVLQEKLADVINKVQKTTQNQNEVGEGTSNALDNKIRNIVHIAENDPIFDEILDEIIGNRTDVPGQSSNKSFSDLLNPNASTSSNKEYSKKKGGIATSVTTETSIFKEDEAANVLTSDTSNSDVIIFNGNLDSLVGATSTIMPQPNPIYVANTPAGFFMLPSVVASPNYIIVPTQSNKVANVMTDIDIMQMQTVILDDKTAHQENDSEQVPVKTLKSSANEPQTSATHKDAEDSLSSEEEVPASKESKTKKIVLRKKLARQAKMKKEISPKQDKRKSPKTPANKEKNKPTTPKSGSHIRTLNFATPVNKEQKNTEESADKKNNSSKKVASKKLFQRGENKSKKTWDADLRDLLTPKDTYPDSAEEDHDLDMSCEDEEIIKNAKLIEEAFKTPAKATPDKATEIEEDSNINVVDVEDSPIINKEPIQPVKNPSEKVQKDETINEKETPVEEEKTKERNNQEPKVGTVESVMVEQTAVYLRNCNAPPRFKKKCNATNYPLEEYEVEVIFEKDIIEVDDLSTSAEVSNIKTTSTKKSLILETPVKELPKTPGKGELTPFTKALEEQLEGMDLLSLPTPNLPITPSFPLTPGINLITPTHTNRPTDYSTSSSYYQPSDTEQNQSLEVMIEECKRLECIKKSIENVTVENVEDENKNQNKDIPNPNELKRMFNESVIGKKNLSLLKRRSSSSSSSEDSDSSCSSSSSDSDSETKESEVDCNINKQENPKRDSYSLRKRPVVTPKPEKLNKSITKKTPKKFKSFNEEISDKRERIKRSLKADAKKPTPPSAKKIKDSQSSQQPEVVEKPVVQPQKNNEPIGKLCDVENEITDDDFALHLSTDEETTNKVDTGAITKEDRLKKCITQGEKETPSDLEAEKLVQGLKERGILLVHKKSPIKNDVPDEELSENELDPTSEANAEISTNAQSESITKNAVLESNNELEISGCEKTETSLNLSVNDLDVSFDVKNFEIEDLNIDFSNSRRKSKRTVYDSKVLEKEMKANVYIESLNMEMERIIKCTQFDTLLQFIPPKARKPRTRTTTDNKEKTNTTTNVNEMKPTTRKPTKSKEKKVAPDKTQKKTEKKQNNSKTTKNDKSKNANCEINDCVVILSDVKIVKDNEVKAHNEKRANVENCGVSPILKSSDDELMNYAVLGSHRVENSESPLSGTKRKYSSEDNEPAEKKYKTEQQQALLKKIDVDTFLNKVHGNAETSSKM